MFVTLFTRNSKKKVQNNYRGTVDYEVKPNYVSSEGGNLIPPFQSQSSLRIKDKRKLDRQSLYFSVVVVSISQY